MGVGRGWVGEGRDWVVWGGVGDDERSSKATRPSTNATMGLAKDCKAVQRMQVGGIGVQTRHRFGLGSVC